MRALYAEVSPALFGVALHMVRRREWAEEVLQDAFVGIWRGAAGYQQRLSAPMPWMMAIVRNRALDCLRQQRAFGASVEIGWREELDEIVPSSEVGPVDLALLGEQARLLEICMRQLGARQRLALSLAFFRDRTHEEIADVLGAPLGTVKSSIRRGLIHLKTCMSHS
nr:ECF RNA polymerase sigma factor SigK [Paraburkholderia busanensis]